MKKDWIAPSRTALLLIDMQVDFAATNGASAKQGHDMAAAQAAVAQATVLADAARAAGVRCIFVRLLTQPNGETPFLKEWQARRGQSDDMPLCQEGTRGAEFVGPMPRPGEDVISKTRYGAFTDTNLAGLLRGHGIDTLVLAGLTTECCIDTTARDAFERDFHVVIATDAVAAYEPLLHTAALRALEINLVTLADCATIQASWK